MRLLTNTTLLFMQATQALREAVKYLIQGKPGPERDRKLSEFDIRIRLIEQFVQAKDLIKTDPRQMLVSCTELLADPNAEVRHVCGVVLFQVCG